MSHITVTINGAFDDMAAFGRFMAAFKLAGGDFGAMAEAPVFVPKKPVMASDFQNSTADDSDVAEPDRAPEPQLPLDVPSAMPVATGARKPGRPRKASAEKAAAPTGSDSLPVPGSTSGSGAVSAPETPPAASPLPPPAPPAAGGVDLDSLPGGASPKAPVTITLDQMKQEILDFIGAGEANDAAYHSEIKPKFGYRILSELDPARFPDLSAALKAWKPSKTASI